MVSSSCREERTLSIREIRDDIERRALERQSKIQRGEIDVPIHYFPVSVTTLYDRLSQLDYRTDFLSLAVPPRERSLLGRCKAGLKALVCRCLRWLFGAVRSPPTPRKYCASRRPTSKPSIRSNSAITRPSKCSSRSSSLSTNGIISALRPGFRR